MANWADVVGTSLTSFKIGLNKLVLDVSTLTTTRTLSAPDRAGTIFLAGDIANAVTQTSATRNETITEGSIHILCDCTSNGITVNLPTAISNKAIICIKKIDSSANTVTIDPFSTQTIDGSTTALLQIQNVAVSLISDGSNWRVF